MKLIGAHNQKKKEGSNSISSRTSPSKLEDNDSVKNSLLVTDAGDFDDEVSSSEVTSMKLPGQGNQNSKMNQLSSESVNSSSVHPMRPFEDEILDYESNASSSSFEFPKGERSVQHHTLARSLSRPMSSKWNDAEKWIMNKQNAQMTCPKKAFLQCQPNKLTAMTNMLRKDLKEVKNVDLSCATSSNEDTTGIPEIRSVCMRDMGTEMTPIPSQEPSRTATPVGATSPLRTPTSSLPATPRSGDPTTTPNGPHNNPKKELSEQELKEKTRREIMALGVQLGKMNIAEWASKDESEKRSGEGECTDGEQLKKIEFEKRAAVWEEAEKTKHTARYRRKEIKIQAWESQQKVKLEAEMRRIEAEVEQMRAHAQAKMVKKIAMARQKSEEKRAAAEARKRRQADKTAAQAEYIRQTGRVPQPSLACCGWLS